MFNRARKQIHRFGCIASKVRVASLTAVVTTGFTGPKVFVGKRMKRLNQNEFQLFAPGSYWWLRPRPRLTVAMERRAKNRRPMLHPLAGLAASCGSSFLAVTRAELWRDSASLYFGEMSTARGRCAHDSNLSFPVSKMLPPHGRTRPSKFSDGSFRESQKLSGFELSEIEQVALLNNLSPLPESKGKSTFDSRQPLNQDA